MHPADKYCNNVLNNKIIACKWVKLCCQRYVDDLEIGHKRGLYFDKESAQYAIDFFQFLHHSKGEWAGQVFELSDWQQFITWNLFGWMREKDGFRRFRTAYLSVARKAGKTTWLAGVGLYTFFADHESGSEVYSAATHRDQARISHSEAVRMVKASPWLKKQIGVFKDNLHIKETASKYEPLGRDSDSCDGLNIHGALIDELHAHKTRDMWDVLETATGARRQPMVIAITTAGYNRQSICWEQNEYTQKILEKTIQDDTYFGIIYTLDDEDEWTNKKVWKKANPNLGISVKLDDMERKCEQAINVPTKQNAFKRLHLNLWTQSETRWILHERWEKCAFPFDEAELKGRKCYGGLDLSSSIDISALILVFPPVEENEKVKMICRFWVPEENILNRVKKDRVPYDVWARQGFIKLTPGNVIDYAFILDQIDKDAQEYDLEEIAFDRWGATKIVQEISEKGLEVVQFGQGFASMSPPSKELEKMILAEEIAHNNNPVLTWMASNIVVKEDPAGNIKPDKEKSTEKIDGMVALIMALDRTIRHKKTKSKYEDENMIIL